MSVPQIPRTRVRARRGGLTWQVTAASVQALQQLAVTAVGTGRISELELSVENWVPPVEGWVGSARIASLSRLEFARAGKGVEIRLATIAPVDASVLLAAACRQLRPLATGDVGPMLTFTPDLPVAAAPLAGRLVDVLAADESRDEHVRRSDILLVASAGTSPETERVRTVVVGDTAWLRDGVPFEVSVDPTVHRPIGRRSTGGAVAIASMVGDRLTVTGPDINLVIAGQVGPADARALRSTLAIVTDDAVPVRLARQLTACGVLVRPTSVPLPDPENSLAWQAMSVRERRHALRHFGPTAALDACRR